MVRIDDYLTRADCIGIKEVPEDTAILHHSYSISYGKRTLFQLREQVCSYEYYLRVMYDDKDYHFKVKNNMNLFNLLVMLNRLNVTTVI